MVRVAVDFCSLNHHLIHNLCVLVQEYYELDVQIDFSQKDEFRCKRNKRANEAELMRKAGMTRTGTIALVFVDKRRKPL